MEYVNFILRKERGQSKVRDEGKDGRDTIYMYVERADEMPKRQRAGKY